ncbi:MAG TPA: hypothetical protein PLU71_03225 [Candidatus Dependentiae bacterium]|nr:hypothetical protein [Candidatus Dependentiae bacterium]HRQ62843.1 hypothetical protein [Candidatus Dependentiae bacterium]
MKIMYFNFLLLCSSVNIFGVNPEISHIVEQQNNRKNEIREQIQYVARRDHALYIAFNDLHTDLKRSQYLDKLIIRVAIVSGISSVVSIGVGLYYFFSA